MNTLSLYADINSTCSDVKSKADTREGWLKARNQTPRLGMDEQIYTIIISTYVLFFPYLNVVKVNTFSQVALNVRAF